MFKVVELSTMPSHSKKTPVTTLRKKVTVSARARTSIRKQRKPSMAGQDGSYIQDPVSTVTHTVTSSSPRIQLSNVYQIKDRNTSKQALLQVIMVMKDATSLPWQAVRSAWATSMHEVEEGQLTWGDATQWALNRLR